MKNRPPRGPAPSLRRGTPARPPYAPNPDDHEERIPGRAPAEWWAKVEPLISTDVDPAEWPAWTDADSWTPDFPAKGGRHVR